MFYSRNYYFFCVSVCIDKTVESFQQDSEEVRTSIGDTANVSFWFTLTKVLMKFFLKITRKLLIVGFLSVKTALKAEILVRRKVDGNLLNRNFHPGSLFFSQKSLDTKKSLNFA